MDMVTVICVKAKPDYKHTHVNHLYKMVKKNLTVPHRFVCLTDDPLGIVCQTKKLPKGVGGWWAKLAMFREGTTRGRVIYFDLDTLIMGNIDFMARYDGDFAILRDFYREDGYGSGVMLWNKQRPDIWDDWIKFGKPIHPLGDQGWMEKKVQNADRIQDLWPNKVLSYKIHCASRKPIDASVVCFHGTPKIEDFHEDHWVRRVWDE